MNKQPHVDPEFKALMPPLTQEEYQQLEQNILTRHKCNDAILLWNGTIVDGFNRFCICVTHGIRFEVKEMDFASRDDAKIWIIENQLGRRNLNAAQRIELALCKEEVLRAKAREKQIQAGRDRTKDEKLSPKRTTLPEEPIDIQKALAKQADVGNGTVQRYMQVKQNGSPELLEQVQSGELKIGTAHRMLMPEIEKQLAEADKLYVNIKAQLPFENEEYNRNICEQLNQLAEQIRRII